LTFKAELNSTIHLVGYTICMQVSVKSWSFNYQAWFKNIKNDTISNELIEPYFYIEVNSVTHIIQQRHCSLHASVGTTCCGEIL